MLYIYTYINNHTAVYFPGFEFGGRQ